MPTLPPDPVAITLDLDALQSLVDGASPGPWSATTDVFSVVSDARGRVVAECGRYGSLRDASDAAFIAAAREAIPALIAIVRALQDQRGADIAFIRDHASRLPQHKQLAISHIADELERLSHHVTAET